MQAKYNLRSANKDLPLLSNFPYSRLTEEEVASLFRAYNTRLGIDTLQIIDIFKAIKQLDRSDFDKLMKQGFDSLKAQDSNYCLVLDQDDQGGLRFT